jgi:two-component system response regulator YesN
MKILLVDDEASHRRGMANLIKNIRPNYEVLIAKNGVEALRIVRASKPDIVITDIRMPNMDGITLMNQLQSEQDSPKIVVLSAYNLFEYAQSAIRHGAYDYLLKPVDPEKIEEILQRIEDQLSSVRNEQNETDELKRKLGVASKSYRNQLLHTWLTERLTTDEWNELIALNVAQGIGFIIFSELLISSEERNERNTDLLLSDLEQALSNIGQSYTFIFEGTKKNRIQAVTIVRVLEPSVIQRNEIRQALEERLKNRGNYPGKLTFGVGTNCLHLEQEGPESYRAAQLAQTYTFYERWRGIVYHDELLTKRRYNLELDSERLFEAVHNHNAIGAVSMSRAAFDLLARDGWAEPSLIKEYASLTVMKLKSRCHGLLEKEFADRLTESAVAEIPACESYSEVMDILEKRLHELALGLQSLKRGRSEFVVEDCIRLIKERYMEDLKQESIAELFYFNASYFSTLFKNQTGYSFSEYLNKIRIRKAKELLTHTALKIYEIAELCGHQDAKYFCRLFKKQTGVSPEVYRHMSLPLEKGSDFE